jgi:hypothetical protein
MATKKNAKQATAAKIEIVRHRDKRKNTPTEELGDFVRDEERHPKTVLYPRNPDLDPQLVWKGKDEQDSQPLEVPVVPIYIQELELGTRSGGSNQGFPERMRRRRTSSSGIVWSGTVCLAAGRPITQRLERSRTPSPTSIPVANRGLHQPRPALRTG